MLKKSITYTDFNDETKIEDFYFHLGQADLVELQFSKEGGLEEWIKRVTASDDPTKHGADIMREFRRLIAVSVGKKNDDGTRFIKNDSIRDDFLNSPAYDVLFMELITDAGAAAAFVNGLVPKQLQDQVAQVQARPHPSDTAATPAPMPEVGATGPVTPQADEEAAAATTAEGKSNVFDEHAARQLTREELVSMDANELKSGLASGKYLLP